LKRCELWSEWSHQQAELAFQGNNRAARYLASDQWIMVYALTREAIGLIDESGTHKSGSHTVGADRQYNGNRGKIENCIVGVHLAYSSPGFQCLLDSRMYLPKSWAEDDVRLKKTTSLMSSSFKPNNRSRWLRSSTL
jgi:SRSO17 transposase